LAQEAKGLCRSRSLITTLRISKFEKTAARRSLFLRAEAEKPAPGAMLLDSFRRQD